MLCFGIKSMHLELLKKNSAWINYEKSRINSEDNQWPSKNLFNEITIYSNVYETNLVSGSSMMGIICESDICTAWYPVWWNYITYDGYWGDRVFLGNIVGRFYKQWLHLEMSDLVFYHQGDEHQQEQLWGNEPVIFLSKANQYATIDKKTRYTCQTQSKHDKRICQWIYDTLVEDMPIKDPETYHDIGRGYAKDSIHVYFEWKLLSGANPNTFTLHYHSDAGDGEFLWKNGKLMKQ